jgi:hypothetical protein
MTARDDEALFRVVRRHVDDKHPDLGLNDEAIRDMIRTDASTRV